MEQFDGKIKNKLASLEYHKPPVNKLMTEMFAKLDSDEAAAQVIEMTADSPVSTFGSWMWKIAASVVLLLVAGWTFYQMQHVEVRTQRAMQITHVFPDGSRAALNAGSTMQYNKLTWKLNRNLKLDGEAFFEVEKGRSFSVSSTQGTTRVLGTSFNVYARNGDYQVECYTGKVQVTVGRDQTLLIPGEGVRHYDGQKEQYALNSNRQGNWRTGQFYFDNDLLIDVAATLSRQFDIEVVLNNAHHQTRYTGYFTDENLETALKLICQPLGLSYKLADGTVVIE
ncbi:MAG: hypothetical protein CMP48_08510 [Rickettsiales bacterium]|nr:hypothetical protein [Rickettsiales bacterium]|tara:strand:- start:1021 stop:1866 length:846 start_codon:yes stop_codon:yes gene_type:complete